MQLYFRLEKSPCSPTSVDVTRRIAASGVGVVVAGLLARPKVVCKPLGHVPPRYLPEPVSYYFGVVRCGLAYTTKLSARLSDIFLKSCDLIGCFGRGVPSFSIQGPDANPEHLHSVHVNAPLFHSQVIVYFFPTKTKHTSSTDAQHLRRIDLFSLQRVRCFECNTSVFFF